MFGGCFVNIMCLVPIYNTYSKTHTHRSKAFRQWKWKMSIFTEYLVFYCVWRQRHSKACIHYILLKCFDNISPHPLQYQCTAATTHKTFPSSLHRIHYIERVAVNQISIFLFSRIEKLKTPECILPMYVLYNEIKKKNSVFVKNVYVPKWIKWIR